MNQANVREEAAPISSDQLNYPALDRAAFLIERICVPRYYPPTYCAEAAQLLAMLEAAQQRRNPQENRPHSMQRTL